MPRWARCPVGRPLGAGALFGLDPHLDSLRVLASLLLLPALVFSGCIAPPPVDPTPAPGSPASSTMGTLGDPEAFVRYLTPEGGFTSEAPTGEPARMPMSWSWTEWLQGVAPPTWYTANDEVPMLITAANVTYYAGTDHPLPGHDLRPEFTAWWGVNDGYVTHTFHPGPDVFGPGDVAEVTMEFDIPAGGLVVTPGDHQSLRIASYYADADGLDTVDLLLAGESAPSRIAFTARPITWPSAAMGREDLVVNVEDGMVNGGRCAAPLNPTGAAMQTYPFEVPEDAILLSVFVDRRGGQGGPDIDFALRNASGDRIASGQGSGGTEHVTLYWPNLAAGGPGTWTLEVYACTPQHGRFEALVTLERVTVAS